MGSDGFGGELRLRSATRERKVEGNYTCYVENQAGSDSATFQVYVQGEVLIISWRISIKLYFKSESPFLLTKSKTYLNFSSSEASVSSHCVYNSRFHYRSMGVR